MSSETLADIIRAHQDATGDSSRQMQAKAQKAGKRLSFTTVNSVLNGDHTGSYKPYTLDAIAAVCGVSRERVWKAAGRTLPAKPFADELPPDADRLSATSRRAVVGVIRALLTAEAGTVTPDDEAAPDNVRELPKRGSHGGDRAAARRRPKGEPRGEDPSS